MIDPQSAHTIAAEHHRKLQVSIPIFPYLKWRRLEPRYQARDVASKATQISSPKKLTLEKSTYNNTDIILLKQLLWHCRRDQQRVVIPFCQVSQSDQLSTEKMREIIGNMLPILNFRTVALALAALLVTNRVFIVIYRLYFHPLASFPGPRLAASSTLYRAYYQVWKDGKMMDKIIQLHKIYGECR